MKKALLAVFAFTLGAGAAFAANVNPQSAGSTTPYYYWLHPKLGMVKVDRATNAMVTSRSVRQASTQSDRGAAR